MATDRDVGEFFPIPRYYDGQLRARRQLGEKKYVELGGLLSSDKVSRSVGSADPAEQKDETKTLRFERIYARYAATEANGNEIRVTPWVGRDRSSLTASFGGTPTELQLTSTHYGLRLAYATRVFESLTGNVGLDLEASSTEAHREGSVSTPPREGDARTFGQPPASQINTSNWRSISGSAAPYVEGVFKIATTKAEVYADVQNVTNRENAEELIYDQNYGQRRTIRGLPILPVVGLRWEL